MRENEDIPFDQRRSQAIYDVGIMTEMLSMLRTIISDRKCNLNFIILSETVTQHFLT